MRLPGLVLCGLLLAACTGDADPPAAGTSPGTQPLTAVAALGDFVTVDYCDLFDPAGGEPVASFDHCWADVDGIRGQVGPVLPDEEAGTDDYGYPGDLPAGVRVRGTGVGAGTSCLRYVGFADDLWLSVSATRSGTTSAEPAEFCAVADELVAGVVDAVVGERVGHVSYEPDSYGGVRACALLDRPEVIALAGAGAEPRSWPSGHTCFYGPVSLELAVAEPAAGTREVIGGREVAVEVVGSDCHVTVERSLRDRPGLVERAEVSGAADLGGGNCAGVRTVAGLVVPDLPA